MEFRELVEKRRSTRKYLEAEVSREDIEEIIRCAQMAPSWKNSETGRYYVAVSSEGIKAVWDCLPDFNQRSAANAALIVATFKTGVSGYGKDSMTEEGDVWGGYDLGLQNAYLLLKAKEMGYDTLIMGLRDVEKIRAYFNIPEDEMVLPVIAIGKAGEEPALRPRKDLSEILKVV